MNRLQRIRDFFRRQSGWRWFAFHRTPWGWDFRLPIGWLVWIGSHEDWARRLYWSTDATPVDPMRLTFWCRPTQ